MPQTQDKIYVLSKAKITYTVCTYLDLRGKKEKGTKIE